MQAINDTILHLKQQQNDLLQKDLKRIKIIFGIQILGAGLIGFSALVWGGILLSLLGGVLFIIGMNIPKTDPDNWSNREKLTMWAQQIEALNKLLQRCEAGEFSQEQAQIELETIVK